MGLHCRHGGCKLNATITPNMIKYLLRGLRVRAWGLPNGKSARGREGCVMREQKRSKRKQRRNFLAKVKLFAAAFYYLVSLTIMLIALWDRFTG